jgi:hypothetical protein
MAEVKLTSGKGDMKQRLADRLKNSGGDLPSDVTTKHGDGARRTFHNLHFSASNAGSTTKQNKKGEE